MSLEIMKAQAKREFGLFTFAFKISSTKYPTALFKKTLASTKQILGYAGFAIPQNTTANPAYTKDQLLGFDIAYDATKLGTILRSYDAAGAVDRTLELRAAFLKANIADSTAATGNTHTAFSNGVFPIPANLRAGQRIKFLVRIKVTGQNSIDTQRFRLLFTGADLTGTAVYDTGTVAYEANDFVVLSGEITVRVAGASGKICASGIAHTLFSADPFTYQIALDETSKDLTSAAGRLVVSAIASSTNAGNTAVLKDFNVEVIG